MKKLLIAVMLILALCFTVSCEAPDDPTQGLLGYTQEESAIILLAYSDAQELGYSGTLEEFLEIMKGADGKDGVDGRGIDNVTIYNGELLIHLTDNTIINLGPITGADGKDGEDGKDGVDGEDGKDGVDGQTPYIGTNGNWWIGQTDTGVKAAGADGEDGKDGQDGAPGKDGEDGKDGTDGKDGVGIADINIDNDGKLIVTLTNGEVKDLGKIKSESNGVSGMEVVQIELNKNKTLTITLANGIKLICQDFEAAVNNIYISALTIDANGVVKATLINGMVMEYGTISTVYMTGDYEIIFEFANGTQQSFGKIFTVEGTACTHTYTDWLQGEIATCCSMGFNSRVCVYCGVLDYDFIPAYGHTWDSTYYLLVSPTKTQSGSVLVRCSECSVAMLEILEPNDDFDGDKLTNGDEAVLFGTNVLSQDTDCDGLSDYEEIFVSKTLPLNEDTDGDDMLDGAEVKWGTDPLVAATNGKADVDVVVDTKDTVKPGLQGELNAQQLNSLEIKENTYFEEETMGYMGKAYDYIVEKGAEAVNAVISFEFEISSVVLYSRAGTPLPTIYKYGDYVDANGNVIKNVLQPLNTTINGNVASAEVDSFGSYILIDRRTYENQLTWYDKWQVGGGSGSGYTNLEIVFVIDDSGSMSSNDRNYERIRVAKEVIATFGDNVDIGIVKFNSSVTNLTGSSLIEYEKYSDGTNNVEKYLTTGSGGYFTNGGGLTHIYSAVIQAAGLFTTPGANDSTYRVMIVLSDGIPEGETKPQTSAISAAEAKGIEIFTVGLGSASGLDTCLKPMSEATNGEYQDTTDLEKLKIIYDKIRERIEMTLDSDNDGLPDYYEENMVSFDGNDSDFRSDKAKQDTDGDGLKDGEEIVINYVLSADGTQIAFMGKVYSNPNMVDSDGDGVSDYYDKYPMNANRK